MKLKYVILIVHGLETPLIFPEWMDHDKAAAGKRVVSAGFVDIFSDTIYEVTATCGGESISLGVKARIEEDSALITRFLRREY